MNWPALTIGTITVGLIIWVVIDPNSRQNLDKVCDSRGGTLLRVASGYKCSLDIQYKKPE